MIWPAAICCPTVKQFLGPGTGQISPDGKATRCFSATKRAVAKRSATAPCLKFSYSVMPLRRSSARPLQFRMRQ